MAFTLFLTFFFFSMVSSHSDPTPLKQLEGIRKGDNVEGVRDIKDYLQRYGYLNYAAADGETDNVNNFDDELESALKTYQQFFKLEPTGIVDTETIALMSMPRCGVPDIHHEKHDGHGHDLHTVSHYSFFRGNPKWPANRRALTYAFSRTVPSAAYSGTSNAFATWARSAPFTFSQISDYNNANLKISFERGNHGDGAAFDGPARPGKQNILAHAFSPQDGRFHYDADDANNFVNGARPNSFDYESLAVHEIGHLLGLDHSSVNNAVMYPILPSNALKRALAKDDIDGIRALYR